MKVLLINKFHYLRGGAEKAYFDTARILEDHGHEVAFFSMHHPKNEKTPFEKYFVEYVDYHHQYSTKERIQYALRILWNKEAQKNLERLIKDFQPDIAHLHNIYHQLSPSIIQILKKNNIPLVMTLHDYKLICPNYSLFVRGHIWEGGQWKCLRDRCVDNSLSKSSVCSLERIFHKVIGVYNKVDIFLSPSLFLKQKFQEKGFVGDIRTISQPITLFDKKDMPIDERERYFVYAGRLSKEKGIDILLKALSHTQETELYLLGEGPERNNLECLAREFDIEDRVRFFGHTPYDKTQAVVEKSKAVIIPSLWYENMPYALVEALGGGNVVIASRIGGIPERIQDQENGFLFEAGNEKELSNILQNIDTFDLDRIRENARESVKDFQEEQYFKNLIAIYQELLEKKK